MFQSKVAKKVFAVCYILTAFHLLFPESVMQAETDPPADFRNLMILPFSFDESPNAELVAGQAAFILRRKLRAGRFVMPEIEHHIHDDRPVIWNNRHSLDEFFHQQKVKWLVSGQVERVSYHRDRHRSGNRFIGMAGIPVKTDITVRLYDCHRRADVWEKVFQAHITVPRLRVFGFNRPAYPATVKSVDAFVHNVMLEAARGILSAIVRLESGVGQDE